MLDFKEKGVDGFVIHARIGLPDNFTYLSDEFMGYVEFAVDEAEKLNMHVILYDEGMYPSGSAHGMVVKLNPSYASIGLKAVKVDGQLHLAEENGEKILQLVSAEVSAGVLKDLKIVNEEQMISSKENGREVFALVQTFSKGTIRGIHYGEDDGEAAAPPSADLLNPDAVDCFIKITYDRYYEVVGKHFGKTVLAMFTDEPCILGREPLEGLIGWTDGFLEDYLAVGGKEEELIGLFYSIGERTEGAKKLYQKAIFQRMSQVYYKKLSDWCANHKISLIGHPEKSNDIGYLKYFQIPGQDIVWRNVAPEEEKSITSPDSVMAKCASDTARHTGSFRNANECFGCCGRNHDHWSFSFEDMMWYLNWLFVRGTNMIIPHAFFYSLRENRSEERPPDVGPNSPWWENYLEVSNYIKRVCALLSHTHNTAKIAVLCCEDHVSWQVTKPLYQNQIEFNYLDKAFLKNCKIENGKLKIKKQEYSVLLLDVDISFDKTMLQILKEFSCSGGTVIKFKNQGSAYILPEKTEDNIVQSLKDYAYDDIRFLGNTNHLRITRIINEKNVYFILFNEGNENLELAIDSEISKEILLIDLWKNDNRRLKNKSKFNMEGSQLLILCY